MLLAPLTHIAFGTIGLYLPFILCGVDRIIHKKSAKLYIISLTLLALSSFYFLYIFAVLTIIYVLIELGCQRSGIVEKIHIVVSIGAWPILALMLSAPVLLPVINGFLSSNRITTGVKLDVTYDLDYYKSIVTEFSNYLINEKWLVLGYSPIVFLSIIYVLNSFSKHKKCAIGVLTVLAIAMMPIAGSVLNGFNYSTNRWIPWGSLILSISVIILLSSSVTKKQMAEVKRLLPVPNAGSERLEVSRTVSNGNSKKG